MLKKIDVALAVEAPRFGKGSEAKEDSSPASIFDYIIMNSRLKSQKNTVNLELIT